MKTIVRAIAVAGVALFLALPATAKVRADGTTSTTTNVEKTEFSAQRRHWHGHRGWYGHRHWAYRGGYWRHRHWGWRGRYWGPRYAWGPRYRYWGPRWGYYRPWRYGYYRPWGYRRWGYRPWRYAYYRPYWRSAYGFYGPGVGLGFWGGPRFGFWF